MAAKKSFLLRVPPDLWEELNRWAKDELRSVNGQIEFLLREATRRRRGEREEEKRKEKREKTKPIVPPPAESSGEGWNVEFD